jgi:hypothetical protein
MHARYIEPLIVVSCNYGGAYILSELNGTVLHHPIATFHLLPYFPHKFIPLPPDIIDINNTHLQEMERQMSFGELLASKDKVAETLKMIIVKLEHQSGIKTKWIRCKGNYQEP